LDDRLYPAGPAHPPKLSIEIGILEKWPLAVSTSRHKGAATAKQSAITQGNSKKIDAKISHEIAHPKDPAPGHNFQGKTTTHHARVLQRFRDRFHRLPRESGIGMEKPQNIALRHGGSGIHLPASPGRCAHDAVRQRGGKLTGPIVTATVRDNNLGRGNPVPQVAQEISDQALFVENWNDDR
jgi:hypothetical protein